MTGYHEVKSFTVPLEKSEPLPEGWKPFAGYFNGVCWLVLARKWHAHPKKRVKT